MAFQYWQQAADRRPSRTSFVCLENAYHGDTVGSVSVGGIDLFHSMYRPLLFDSHRVPAGDAAALEQRAERARRRDRGGRGRAAGAGRRRNAAPAARLPACGARACATATTSSSSATRSRPASAAPGRMFACEQEGVAPDFLCLAKGLTGGYMPLAATLTTERVHDGFLGEYEEFRTFFHGHTYTGNPLACAAALATLDVFEEERTLERLAPKISAAGAAAARPGRAAAARGRGPPAWASCAASSWPTATGSPTTGAPDGPPGDARGPRPRRDRAPARRRRRPDAAAVDRAPTCSRSWSRSWPTRSPKRPAADLASYPQPRPDASPRTARSPSCARRTPGRTSRPGSARTPCRARCPRRGLPRPGRR